MDTDAFFDPLAEPVERRFHSCAHLLVVLKGEVVDGRGIGCAVGCIGVKGPSSLLRFGCGVFGVCFVDSVRVQDVEEDSDVFEASVHALAVERYHGVSGVTQDYHARVEVVRSTFD